MDKKLKQLIEMEEKRQATTLQLIPSENRCSEAVREALASVLTNKYSEGYAHKRYYQGNALVDEVEDLAVERAKILFKVPFVNVQPYSGSPANMAVYFALLNREDTILGMELISGGHLTHGHPKITFSGKFFNSVQYSVDSKGYLDYQQIEQLALKYKPKIIISGSTAYPRIINFKKIGEIADKTGAYHLADISHIAGLVAGNVHPSPVSYADIVVTTTHKTLRGPRGAVIMVTDKGLKKDPELGEKINKAVFPGLQGGPHNNQTAAMAQCLYEASQKSFSKYAKQVVENAKTLAKELTGYGFKLLTEGTDNHLILLDLTNKDINGWQAAWALEYAGVIVNKNTIPGEKGTSYYPSGIRLGTPFVTTVGMKEKEMKLIANFINQVVEIARKYKGVERKDFKEAVKNNKNIKVIKKKVECLCKKFK